MKAYGIILIVLILLIPGTAAAKINTADDCTTEEVKAFDFLVGEWKEQKGKGRMSITKVLEGCGVQEIWRLEGFNAILLRSYDSTKKTWYLAFTAHDLVPQVWEGKLEKGTWVFYRDWELNGKARRSRTFWKSAADDGFEKIVEQLNDDKKSWRLHDRAVFVKSVKKKQKRPTI